MIRRLYVTNFKSLKDFPLTLGARNVLVGANMAGKSNVISVFRFLAQMVLPTSGVNGLVQAFLSQGGFAEVVWRGGDSNLVTFSLDGDFGGLEEGGEDMTWEYAIRIAGDRRSGSIAVQDESLRCSGAGGQVALIERDPSSGRRVLRDGRGETITEVSDANRSALEFELPDWDGNRLRRLFASFRFYNLVPQVMKQTNPLAATPFLDITGANLSAWLMMLQTRHREESFDSINSAAQDVFPDLANLLTWPMPQSTVFLASMERHLKSAVPVWQMSDGELCFIALLSLIFSPRELSAPLYCIEEPENHLHPRLIEVLVGLLEQRQQEAGARAAQVVATTHSPQLVDKTRLEDLVVIEKRDGATVGVRPSQQRHLQELLSREDMGLGELYYSGALSSA